MAAPRPQVVGWNASLSKFGPKDSSIAPTFRTIVEKDGVANGSAFIFEVGVAECNRFVVLKTPSGATGSSTYEVRIKDHATTTDATYIPTQSEIEIFNNCAGSVAVKYSADGGSTYVTTNIVSRSALLSIDSKGAAVVKKYGSNYLLIGALV